MSNNQTKELKEWIANHYFGKYRGVVIDNNDPLNRGRIKVNVPGVLGNMESWAMPCLPYTGNGVGSYVMPEAGSGVWVEFEAGDVSFPIWSGGFWADTELPQNEEGTTASPWLKIFRTAGGIMATFDDLRKIITLSDQNGRNMLSIDVERGCIRINADTSVILEAPQIELAENSTHPLVFGDDLLNYLSQLVILFNTHVHPGGATGGTIPGAPTLPVPPMPPPVPGLLSLRVKTG